MLKAACCVSRHNETEKPKRRGLFGLFGKKQPDQREPALAQQDLPGQPGYGTGQRDYGTGQPAAGGAPGGAWAGSRLNEPGTKGTNVADRVN